MHRGGGLCYVPVFRIQSRSKWERESCMEEKESTKTKRNSKQEKEKEKKESER